MGNCGDTSSRHGSGGAHGFADDDDTATRNCKGAKAARAEAASGLFSWSPPDSNPGWGGDESVREQVTFGCHAAAQADSADRESRPEYSVDSLREQKTHTGTGKSGR